MTDVAGDEEEGEVVYNRMHFFSTTRHQLQKRKRDKSEADAVCNAEGERHHQHRKERRDRFRDVFPINLTDIPEHQPDR